MGGFNNKEIAKRAGQVSKRGEQKVGVAVKRAINSFVMDKLSSEEVEKLWNALEPRDQAKFILGLLPYIIRPVSVSPLEEETQHSTIEVEFISKNDSIIITNNN